MDKQAIRNAQSAMIKAINSNLDYFDYGDREGFYWAVGALMDYLVEE